MGFVPKKVVADSHMKLIGGALKTFFTDKETAIEGPPPQHQRQNGLVKNHWRTLVWMAQSWINAALLSSLFW